MFSRRSPWHIMVLFIIFFEMALVAAHPFFGQGVVASSHIIYVNHAASGGDGSSWTSAFKSLQAALAVATPGDEIWVAKGVYKPTTNAAERTATFQLKSGVAIYGGFLGTESVRDARDSEANVTVLSGDIDNNDVVDANGVLYAFNIVGANSHSVVTGSGVDGTAILDGFRITGGQAGALPYWYGGGVYTSAGSPTLTNLVISGNSGVIGAGMYNIDGSNPTITNVHIFFNTAGWDGGGIVNNNSSPTLTNVLIIGNKAEGGGPNSGKGGGMLNQAGSRPVLTYVTIDGNSATHGGGMFNSNNSNPVMTDVQISINSTLDGGSGGGIYNENSSPELTNSWVMSNTADLRGGGIFNTGSNPKLVNVTILGNTALNGRGGGMYNEAESIPTLTDSTISRNTATGGETPTNGRGGGISNNGNSHLELHNTSITNNSATYGGGIHNSQSRPTITQTTLSGNNAVVGGGMHNESGSHLTLTNVVISGNEASSYGGGIRNFTSSPLLTNVSVLDNVASSGGGMHNENSSHPGLNNVLISGNFALNYGGGIENFINSNPTLINVTISGNRAGLYGGGISNLESSPIIQNSIIWRNRSSNAEQTSSVEDIVLASIYNSGGDSKPTIRYSLVQNCNTGGMWQSDCGIDGGNMVADGDPLFIDPIDPVTAPTSEGNLRLQLGSPAINMGNNAYVSGIETDLAGNPRIMGQNVDLGAYETNAPPIANAGSNQTVDVSAAVTLNGSASSDPDNHLPLSYGWSQSGGPTVALTGVSSNQVTFSAPSVPAILTFSLVVTDSLGLVGIPASVVVTVVDVPISGLSALNSSPTILGGSTAFTATASSGSNIVYTWNFGDSTSGSGSSTSHTYPTTGTYAASITATNSAGSVTASTGVNVINTAPAAHAGGNQTVSVGAVVTLDGSASSDPDSHLPLIYTWSQTDGPVVTLDNASGISPTFTAPSTPTTLTFRLVVRDSFGLASESASVTIMVIDGGGSGTMMRLFAPSILRN